MATGRITQPGSEYGPCVDENCGHLDCVETRNMAGMICHYCNKSIGYQRGFYNLDQPDGLVHSSCYEDAIEEEMKGSAWQKNLQ